MNKKVPFYIACAAFTIAALMSVSSCSMQRQGNQPHFTGEGKCPVCGTYISKHQVEQQSTVDKAMLQELLKKDYSICEYDFGPKRMVWKDDTVTETQERILPFFMLTDVGEYRGIVSTGVVISDIVNDVYIYFTQDANGIPTSMRLRIQYYADDPLNYNQIAFVVDGFDYPFTPTNIKCGDGEEGYVWQQSDDELHDKDKDLVYAISHCENWAELKLVGADGMEHIKPLTREKLDEFKRTLQLFLLRGGSLK